MILHSIKSIVRTPKKTMLFLLLITILSAFLSIGAGMYQSAHNMILDADKTFSTTVELNYLGDKGNDEEAFYEQMNKDIADFDFQSLNNHSSYISMNVEGSAYAYIDEKQINQSMTELENYVILEVVNIRPYSEGVYQGIINKVLFGRTMREDTHILLNDLDIFGDSIGYNFVYGHKYLIIGRRSRGKNPTPIITPGLPKGIEGVMQVVDLSEFSDFYISEEGYKLEELVDAFHVVDNSLPVTMVTSLEASKPYFNKEMIITEGRIFSQEEYDEKDNEVIIISKTLANFFEVNLGDKLDLKLHYATNGIGLTNYLQDYTFPNEASYKIIGIFDNKEDNRFRIYMPMADWIKQDKHSSSLARYLVKNGKANKFIKEYEESLLPNMEFTIYDQGYEAAIKPIVELRNTSIILLTLGGFSGLIILLLFSYLYVIKQRDTLINMLSLGAGKKRTLIYILFGSIVLVTLSSTIGAYLSSTFLNRLTEKIYNRMVSLYKTDMRYSERAIGPQMDFTAKVSINHLMPVIIIIIMILISFILLYLFTLYILNQDKYKKFKVKKVTKRVKKVKDIPLSKAKKEQNVMFGSVRPMPLKFALVSLIRNSGRSFIVPLLSLILSIFLVFLGFLSNIQKEKRASVYDNIPVTAYITTYKNETRDLGGLSLQYDIYRLIDPDYSYRMEFDWDLYYEILENGLYTVSRAIEEREKLLKESEYIEEMHLYSTVHYEYMGISRTKDGIEVEEVSSNPNIRKHRDVEGFDWFLDAIPRMPKLAYADDIRYTPDFFGKEDTEVNFLSGYSYDSLMLNENISVIPRGFAAKNGINLGDTIRITAWFEFEGYAVCSVLDLLVVGIYDQTWQSDVLYLPWITGYEHEYYIDYEYMIEDTEPLWNEYLPRIVRAATFTLKNTENLDSFREYLHSQGYSEAGRIKANRRAIVIQDKNLEETIKTLDNHIKLMEILRPVLIILFGIIGFIVSYLLIRHRLNELAIMRSMGASKLNVFFSFFIEQLILFMVGLLPVILFGFIKPNYFAHYGLSLGYFFISYLLGTGVALIYLGKTDLLDILFSKE